MGEPIMVVTDASTAGPILKIRVICSECRAVVSDRTLDMRELEESDASPIATADAEAWLAHACPR